jgi:hypothetical protein
MNLGLMVFYSHYKDQKIYRLMIQFLQQVIQSSSNPSETGPCRVTPNTTVILRTAGHQHIDPLLVTVL